MPHTPRSTIDSPGNFIAHTARGLAPHALDAHLTEAARHARGFASPWGGEAAALAALWHDLGKYSDDFQAMIRAAGDEDGHLEDGPRRKVNHSSAGARHACRVLGLEGLALAYVIAGHHGGLADYQGASSRTTLKDRLSGAEPLMRAALTHAPPHITAQDAKWPGRPADADPSLWIRILASAVFDADFLDTEEYFDRERSAARAGWASVDTLRDRLTTRLKRFDGATGTVNEVRATVLAACREAARGAPGLYSLTVPTGGGKTLASQAFALEHIAHHPDRLRRVIYAVPFTSIIEQTADVFRGALGGDSVLEHHSALEAEHETNRTRLAAENWDAPVIVTTTVQLFESLFAARTSRLRKLHNIAGSAIILDEAQSIPADVLRPVTAVLTELVRTYGVTVVLCTATQPALGAVLKSLPPVQEIVPDPPSLFSKLKRVDVRFPEPGERRSWVDIAADMAALPQALAIVNSRADCRALHALLPEGAIHLSTWQCPAHRASLLKRIKADLLDEVPVRVVSTSLIEAGVDVDFPAVFRAMAGLDSIAQAAGRCNREGRLPGRGQVQVFRPEDGRLTGFLLQAAEAAEAVLARHGADPFHPQAFEEYFRELYWSRGSLDACGMGELLGLGATRRGRDWFDISFRTAAERFHMVDDDQQNLVVLYDDDAEAAADSIRRHGPSRDTLRQLQRYTVPVRPKAMIRLRAMDAVEDVADGVTVLVTQDLYDRDGVGLMADKEMTSPK